jgi:hypothetical protein
VGKVDCFSLSGLYIWFNSNDRLPPHFHAEKVTSWEVRIFFLRDPDEMIELAWGRKEPTSAERKRIVKAAEEHREQLLGEWEQKASVQTPGAER